MHITEESACWSALAPLLRFLFVDSNRFNHLYALAEHLIRADNLWWMLILALMLTSKWAWDPLIRTYVSLATLSRYQIKSPPSGCCRYICPPLLPSFTSPKMMLNSFVCRIQIQYAINVIRLMATLVWLWAHHFQLISFSMPTNYHQFTLSIKSSPMSGEPFFLSFYTYAHTHALPQWFLATASNRCSVRWGCKLCVRALPSLFVSFLMCVWIVTVVVFACFT